MKNHKVATLFHDIIGPASSIRSFLYFILRKKDAAIDEKTEYFLQASLEKCEELIEKLQDLRSNWEAGDQKK